MIFGKKPLFFAVSLLALGVLALQSMRASNAQTNDASKLRFPSALLELTGMPYQSTFTSARSLPNDVQTIPISIAQQEYQISTTQNISGAEPTWSQTSDFMLGEIAVSIILPNCVGGSCTQGGWLSSDVNNVLNEVNNALQWWETQAASNNAYVDFQLVTNPPLQVNTSYEPIDFPGGGSLLCGNEGVWIDDVMANMGYNNYSGSDTYLMEVREYNNDLRDQYGTDWAFTIFVADSSHNSDGNFAPTDCNGTVPSFSVPAYAYIGGPFLVMNTINNGYGSIFVDGVAAHEIGHIFGAPDEAPSNTCKAGVAPTCDTPYGYLGGQNQNCNQSCSIDLTLSLMRWPEDYGNGTIQNIIHSYTVQQIGWKDSDGDGRPDPIDTFPDLALNSPPSNTNTVTPTFNGSTQDIPFPSALPLPEPSHLRPAYPDETINDIISVEYRVDGSSWYTANSVDGEFDSAMEDFTFSLLLCENKTYSIQVRAQNSVGNYSNVQSHNITVNSTESCKNTYLPVTISSNSSQEQQSLTLPFADFQSKEAYPSPMSSDLNSQGTLLQMPNNNFQSTQAYP